jgi:hypothetical protein
MLAAARRLERIGLVLVVVVAVKRDDSGDDPGNVCLAHDEGGSDQVFRNCAFLIENDLRPFSIPRSLSVV